MADVKVRSEEKINVLEAVANMAREEGCEYAFTIPGGNSITLDTTCSEQASRGSCSAMSRVAALPWMPGAGFHAVPVSALLAPVPASPTSPPACPGDGLRRTGRRSCRRSGTVDDDNWGGQGIARSEQQFAGITKWVRRVTHPNTLLFQTKRAFRSTVTHQPARLLSAIPPKSPAPNSSSPGHRRIPTILPDGCHESSTHEGDPRLVEQLVKWLLEAERPTMVVGHAAHQDDCQDEMSEFVHLLGLPTSTRRVARGMISELDP